MLLLPLLLISNFRVFALLPNQNAGGGERSRLASSDIRSDLMCWSDLLFGWNKYTVLLYTIMKQIYCTFIVHFKWIMQLKLLSSEKTSYMYQILKLFFPARTWDIFTRQLWLNPVKIHALHLQIRSSELTYVFHHQAL